MGATSTSESSKTKGEDPCVGLDLERLTAEMDRYHQILDDRTEEAYLIAEVARKKGLDWKETVEIPRASDLASRTEKLLFEYLDGFEVADDIRNMLAEHDRETTSILMAQKVARAFKDNGTGLETAIDVGLRVGLAVLTEAVLVAPLEGISEVRLLNNLDGSQFVSVHFAGPIRAAGGTAQALAVLIADMIRRELDVGHYQPTDGEVERVKEEFGLYRGNLQYRPSPEEIEMIVKACPVMVNGESTESIECAGYGNVRNIDESRIRGGVLLVIGEGLCLKAPKIQKHTERLEVPGWDFISKFANKGKSKDGEQKVNVFKSKKVPPITKFMKDIIAGRPVFGAPLAPGGFRLRYGRPRPSGLAAAGANEACMTAMDDFITVGTQMKIERPGKACAIVPCDDTEGPWVILQSGQFLRFDDAKSLKSVKKDVRTIWDNGELVLGYGEFMENNKNLVPAGYTMDWWASDLLEIITTEKEAEVLCEILDITRKDLPEGVPAGEMAEDEKFHIRRKWHNILKKQEISWIQAKETSTRFGCSLPPPYNPWFLDLPYEWLPAFYSEIKTSIIESSSNLPNLGDGVVTQPLPSTKQLRFVDAVKNWNPASMTELMPEEQPNFSDLSIPGTGSLPESGIFSEVMPEWWTLMQHGLVKGACLILGLAHHHDGDDIVVTTGWEAMLEGLGFTYQNDAPSQIIDASKHFRSKIEKFRRSAQIIAEERARKKTLEREKSTVRIAAETEARQQGKSISETDAIGKAAADELPDPGPADADAYNKALNDEDDYGVVGILEIVRTISNLRWEHSAPVRIGCRMGRPEKAAARKMNPLSHALMPIDLFGGVQRLITNASEKGNIRVQMGRRICQKCGKESPFIRCHHRILDEYNQPKVGETCQGRTEMTPSQNNNGRRRGELQSIPLDSILEDLRIRMGMARLPAQVKCVKKLTSKIQTPEPIEKGILRALHDVPVFRDGTTRYDMSDVPVTHFRPREIKVSWKKLKNLGYTHDIEGNKLENDEQVLEIFPQDFIVALDAGDYFVRVAQFIDDLLVRYYDMEPYYNVSVPDDLIGHLICALAPHTSGGVLSRIIGWADCSGGYAHPLMHAAKRRNCDGDEDAIMLLMDGLLNFSRDILPANRGGQMDAPLVLTTRLNPTEVDKEALNVDAAWYYEARFYEATLNQPHPKEVSDYMDFVERRLGTIAAVRGYGYTHDCDAIDAGPRLSAYKTLETMKDKMNGQLELGQKLRGVNVRNVASSVIRSHFLPDLRGNLNAYGRQKVRCLKCGHSYRRMPIAGQCIQIKKVGPGGLSAHGVMRSEGDQCGGNLALTVSEGAVRKYIEVTKHVMATYGVDTYTEQNVEWLTGSVESLFNNDKARQMSLSDFL